MTDMVRGKMHNDCNREPSILHVYYSNEECSLKQGMKQHTKKNSGSEYESNKLLFIVIRMLYKSRTKY